MSVVSVLGTQWGDEGKGKIVDYLAQQAQAVVRYGGGSNAGHTVSVNNEEYKLRLMPSGILFKGTLCIVGNGVAFNPKDMLAEMDAMTAKGIDISGVRISNRAHVVLPYHNLMDGLLEEAKGKAKVGTTKNGIGPCYVDRDNRIGIRVCDFIDEEVFAERLKENLEFKNKALVKMFGAEPLDYDAVLKEYQGYARRLKPYICDTIALVQEEIKAGHKILCEGAQATMLDIDYGTYPYCTASHPVSGGICVGAGIAPRQIDKVFGVAKAYCSRVGEGPFPTEQLNEVGNALREAGHEYGTVMGRPRRIGWLDAFVVRYAGLISGIDYLAITRLDILDGLDEIKMCVGYKYKGKLINEIPASLKVLSEVEPVYETFKGWKQPISGIREYDKLPAEARRYLERLAEVTGIELGIVSVGPNRDQTIVLVKDAF